MVFLFDSFASKAAYYIETLKWPVFPQNPATKAPCIKGGCHAATLNPEVVAEWDRLYPSANVAVSCGRAPTNIIVVDLDGPAAEEAWGRVVKEHLFTEPNCPVVLTARGRHLYFTGTGVKNSCGQLGKCIDVKSEGGAATLPPSVHGTGVVYEWVDRPDVVRPPPFPPVLAALLNRHNDDWKLKYKIIHPNDRPPSMDRLASMVIGASEGQRNHTLNRAAFIASKAVRAGTVTMREAESILTQAAIQAGLLRHEIQRTIMSGLRGGAKKL
jgi:Bifunctional DNA primase/polymerase, N-terminal